MLYFFYTGDWHQYDDIICAEPSHNMLKRFKEKFWPEERRNLIQGREIAGNIMLESIFDLLRSWSEDNLRSFWIQLRQFFEVYGEPFVYEEKQKQWHSLDYGKDDVSSHSLCIMCRSAQVWQLNSAVFWCNLLGEKDAKGIHADEGDSSVAEGWRRKDALHSGSPESSCDHALCVEKFSIQFE